MPGGRPPREEPGPSPDLSPIWAWMRGNWELLAAALLLLLAVWWGRSAAFRREPYSGEWDS